MGSTEMLEQMNGRDLIILVVVSEKPVKVAGKWTRVQVGGD